MQETDVESVELPRKRELKIKRKTIEQYQLWSEAEHQLAVEMVKKYGKQWHQICRESFPQRTPDQIKAHLYKVRNKIRANPAEIGLLGHEVFCILDDSRKTANEKYLPWTENEHQLVIALLKIHGKNWRLIQKSLPQRTCAQLRSHLQKQYAKVKSTGHLDILGSEVYNLMTPQPF